MRTRINQQIGPLVDLYLCARDGSFYTVNLLQTISACSLTHTNVICMGYYVYKNYIMKTDNELLSAVLFFILCQVLMHQLRVYTIVNFVRT
jgi:hypothetical protein